MLSLPLLSVSPFLALLLLYALMSTFFDDAADDYCGGNEQRANRDCKQQQQHKQPQ